MQRARWSARYLYVPAEETGRDRYGVASTYTVGRLHRVGLTPGRYSCLYQSSDPAACQLLPTAASRPHLPGWAGWLPCAARASSWLTSQNILPWHPLWCHRSQNPALRTRLGPVPTFLNLQSQPPGLTLTARLQPSDSSTPGLPIPLDVPSIIPHRQGSTLWRAPELPATWTRISSLTNQCLVGSW